MLPEIDNEEAELAAWSIKGPPYHRPNTPFLDDLKGRAETLTAVGWDNIDLDLALFAVKAYARRNHIAHGKGAYLLKSREYEELAKTIEEDERALESLLPE